MYCYYFVVFGSCPYSLVMPATVTSQFLPLFLHSSSVNCFLA
nr:MAG TPA: hypothetical protein [Caudoviricetes sp.]